MFDSSSLRIVPAARVAMPDDDIADQPRIAIPGGPDSGSGSQTQQDPLTAGLGEGEDQIDTAKLAADLGLVPEDAGPEGMNTWDWE
jgi:hypothetical protein